MDYEQTYREKLTTAEKAVECIQSGDWIDYGWSILTPRALDHALALRAEELRDVKIRGGLVLHLPEIAQSEKARRTFIWNAWHTSARERGLVRAHAAYYIPMRFSELPGYYRNNLYVDVAMFQAAPMDEDGWFNFGPNPAYLEALCERADKIIIEVNRNIPRCHALQGKNGVHVDQVYAIVEGNDPLLEELETVEQTETDLAVARHVVNEITDGACLQLGIGAMPNAIGQMIASSDLCDLGIHSEMYVESFMDMALAGRITGAKKQIDCGLQTYSVTMGSRRLYDYLGNEASCRVAPINYINDVRRIAAIDNFISINGAVEVDLYGQVSSESVGTQHISGAGGQQDFVLGAYLSKGGKSFICFASTYLDKQTGKRRSRIRPTLREGTIVTCTRSNLHYLATEFGVVNVKGLSTWERAEALISIAHPDFQEELIREADQMGIWRRGV